MKNIIISLRGTYLPNIGGVSLHISRLVNILKHNNSLGCVYSVSNLGVYKDPSISLIDNYYPLLKYAPFQSLLWVIKYGIKDKSNIIHMHGNPAWEAISIFILILLGKNLVYTIHDQMMLDNLDKYPRTIQIIFKKISHHKKIHWIVVNETIKNQLQKINSLCKNITIIPAYISSNSDDEPLDNLIEKFLLKKSKIISIYANKHRKYNDKDLYGIDLAISSLSIAKKQVPNIGLIVCIPDETNTTTILEDYDSIIQELNLNEDILFYLQPVNNPCNLWKRSDVVLRPTLTDGDSLVVREALNEGTTVIASDVVQRPNEVILFKSEDLDDLASKLIFTLTNPKELSNLSSGSQSNYSKIIEVYNSSLIN